MKPGHGLGLRSLKIKALCLRLSVAGCFAVLGLAWLVVLQEFCASLAFHKPLGEVYHAGFSLQRAALPSRSDPSPKFASRDCLTPLDDEPLKAEESEPFGQVLMRAQVL